MPAGLIRRTPLVIALALTACGEGAGEQAVHVDLAPAGIAAPNPSAVLRGHRGVAWTAGPDSIDPTDFGHLARSGVNWIAQTPFGWQPEVDRPELNSNRGRRVWWGERDEGLTFTTLAAREAGIATLLKPHIWLFDRESGAWRGEIAMTSEEDWATWFANYTDFMMHYARLAEELEIEALCIGTELHGTVTREAEWRSLIEQIRTVYSGRLTYAANWYEEYEDVPFWDALDWIGIQAYFPLTESEFPDADEMEQAWQRWMDDVERLSQEVSRPVLFTEVGYRSVPYAGKEPWTWPTRGERTLDERAFAAQAAAYEGLFRAASQRTWLEGLYLWKWYPTTARSRNRSADFTPQGKPAEDVMADWYRRGGEAR